jgi:DNA-binding NtrC family response regulator
MSADEDTTIMTLEQVEQAHIEQTLQLLNDNKAQAARVLGIDRRTLYRKLEKYDLERKANRPIPYVVNQ